MSMHFSWQTAVTKSALSSSTKLVLLVIGTYMNQHGDGAFPAYKTIAEDASLNRATVIRHVEIAIAEGWLEKRTRVRMNAASGRAEADSNTYRISFPAPAESGQGSRTARPPLVAQGDHPSRTARPPLVAQGDPNTPSLTPQVTQEHAPVVPAGDSAPGELLLTNGQDEGADKVNPTEVIRETYNRMLGSRKGCTASLATTPSLDRKLRKADANARRTCKAAGVIFDPVEFWEIYFQQCLDDPWMRGDRPNPNNPRWKQSLPTLIDDDRFEQVMNTALASLEMES